MKRSLLSQIKNDWKENIWLVIELFIITLIIWWLSLTLLRTYKDYHIPLGADISNVYGAELDYMDKDGEFIYGFEECDPETLDRYVADLQALLDRIRSLPMVEAAAIGQNCLPYNYNYSGNVLSYINGSDTLNMEVNVRSMTPDAIKVLHIESTDGHSPQQLQHVLENGQFLFGAGVSTSIAAERLNIDLSKLVGAELTDNYAGQKIGGMVHNIRRNDYEVNLMSNTIIIPIRENTRDMLDVDKLMIRIRPGMEKEFEKAMQSEPALIAPTTIAISQLRALTIDKQLILWKTEASQRTTIAGIIFLLVIVFIGLLGTFWYRVYLRTAEIAIRKTFGATDMDIFRRLTTEAMLILLTAIVMALVLYFSCLDFVKSALLFYISKFTSWKWDVGLSWIITAAVMALIILIGVGIPARRAMRIEPAIALKEE